jgi:predicted lipoprotein with Yx(FWY)xxD motif
VTVRLVRNTKLGEQILVNPAGKTLYLYVPDGSSTTSTVPAAIKANWPPTTAPAGTIGVGAGVSLAKVAVHKQSDGVRQVAYNGHLLYTFIGDTKPGDVTGQGLGGVWYAVLATGVKAT